MSLPILYRDEVLVAVHKPSGLLVHRTMLDRHETAFAVQLVRDQIGQKVYPVHRLDKGTSGVLLFALDPAVAAEVGARFATRDVFKRYEAVVRGHPPAQLTIDHPLPRQRDPYETFGLDIDTDAMAQEAVTTLKTLACCELPFAVDRYPTSRYARVELLPQTGRRHQLRRHLKHIAHPIIGDATYGKGLHNRALAERFGCRRLLLACTQLQLPHPLSGAMLTLDAAPAADFAAAVAALELD